MNENSVRGVARPERELSRRRPGAPRLGLAALLNVAFGAIQVAVGIAIGSIVVLADAAHQAVDALGLITAWIALRIARRPVTANRTFGAAKADALGAFVSAALLIGSVLWIASESINRLFEPVAVAGPSVVAIGLAAVAVNAVGVVLVGRGEQLVSLRAARLHLLTDLAGSVIVVIAGVVLAAGGPVWIDAVSSLLLSAVVLVSVARLTRSAVDVLLDRSVITSDEIAALLDLDADVREVHHVHVWPLGGGIQAASAHVVVEPAATVHDAHELVDRLRGELARTGGVAHATLQVECHACDDEVHDLADVAPSTHQH